jgi:hypothetical protein
LNEGIEEESKATREADAEKKEEGAKADETGDKDIEKKVAEEVRLQS